MSETFKTITYTYFDSGQPDVAAVLPQAMQTLALSQALVLELSQAANVLFIESGYFGITKVGKKDQIKNYTGPAFVHNLHKLIQTLDYRKLFLVGGSIGSIHALAYLEAYPAEVDLAVLAGPSLYRNRGSLDRLSLFLMHTLAYSLPDLYIDKSPWYKDTLHSVPTSVGGQSYFLGLGEIIKFTTTEPERLPQLLRRNVHIILGDQDDVFAKFCDPNLCQQATSCETIPSGHSVLNIAGRRITQKLLYHALKG